MREGGDALDGAGREGAGRWSPPEILANERGRTEKEAQIEASEEPIVPEPGPAWLWCYSFDLTFCKGSWRGITKRVNE